MIYILELHSAVGGLTPITIPTNGLADDGKMPGCVLSGEGGRPEW
jgi:hypothetical protein